MQRRPDCWPGRTGNPGSIRLHEDSDLLRYTRRYARPGTRDAGPSRPLRLCRRLGELGSQAGRMRRSSAAFRRAGSPDSGGNTKPPRSFTAFCGKFGLHNFHEQVFPLGSFQVAGQGYSNITPFQTPGEYTEEQLEERLTALNGRKPLFLVCHCPPFRTMLDRIMNFRHAGSTAVRARY